jgi:nucleotide-binding universal stress UspA family protein
MENIVLGHDGSDSATEAARAAARLFPDARLTVVHLWSSPIADPEARRMLTARAKSLDELIEITEREGADRAERLLEDVAENLRAEGSEVETFPQRLKGGPGFQLVHAAQELGGDLIVVGARGLGGAKAILGSNSDLVVHVSDLPVLVVPQPVAAGPDELASGGVVVGFDGSEGSRSALDLAVSLFPGRDLVAASVDEAEEADSGNDGEGVTEAEMVALQSAGRGARGVAGALIGCAAERGSSVVVVGSRGRSAAREILTGSVAMATLHAADRPVLVVPTGRFN